MKKENKTLSDEELIITNVDWQQVTEFYPKEPTKFHLNKLKKMLMDEILVSPISPDMFISLNIIVDKAFKECLGKEFE